MIVPLRKIQTTDRILNMFQDLVVTVVNRLCKVTILDGTQLTNIVLTTTVIRVNHTLNREPLGYIITGLNKNAVIWSTGQDSNTISLTSSATGTVVSIWVY